MQYDEAMEEAHQIGLDTGRAISAGCEADPADDDFVAEVLEIEENGRQYGSFANGTLQELRELGDSIDDGARDDIGDIWDAYEEGVAEAARRYQERILGEDVT